MEEFESRWGTCEQCGIQRKIHSFSDLLEARWAPLSCRGRGENSGREGPEPACIRRSGHGCRSLCDAQNSGMRTRSKTLLGEKKIPGERSRWNVPCRASYYLTGCESGCI